MESSYIREVLAGNTSRFSWFVDTYKVMAYTIAFRVLKNKEDAEDVVQESFVKAYRSLGSFREQGKFSTWFFRIVVNTALTRWRGRKLHLTSNIDVSDSSALDVNDAYVQLSAADRRQSIDRALSRIPGDDALLLTLHYLNENSLEEISEITGITYNNLKVKLHRARQKLLHKLHEMKIATNDAI